MKKEIWKKGPKTVAREILGWRLVFGSIDATILEVEGYSRKQNSSGIYTPLLNMAPGQVYCPRRRNSILCLIVTNDGDLSGGCVLIRSIEVNGVIYHGPGKVTSALGITDARALGHAELTDDEGVILHIGSLLKTESRQRTPPEWAPAGNRIGKKALTRLMPRIIAKYMKDRPGVKFGEFLNRLLETSQNEADFRRKIFQ